MKLTQRLLGHVGRVFEKGPGATLALRLRYDGAMTWTVADGVLTTSVAGGSGRALSIDLAGFTVAQLGAALALLPGYSVPYVDGMEVATFSALCLIDSSGDQNVSNGDHINAYTSLLWAFFDGQSVELETAQAAIGQAVLQVATNTAEGEWVDVHGTYYGVLRNQGEADAAYSARMISQVSRARGNGIAIAEIVKVATSAQACTVSDVASITTAANGRRSYGLFDVTVDLDINVPLSFEQIDANARSVIEQMRDAGTHLRTLRYVFNVAEQVEAYAYPQLGAVITILQGDGHTDWINDNSVVVPWVNAQGMPLEWFPAGHS